VAYIGMWECSWVRGDFAAIQPAERNIRIMCGEHGIFGRPWKLIRHGDLAFL
jgi:hypothetical protein